MEPQVLLHLIHIDLGLVKSHLGMLMKRSLKRLSDFGSHSNITAHIKVAVVVDNDIVKIGTVLGERVLNVVLLGPRVARVGREEFRDDAVLHERVDLGPVQLVDAFVSAAEVEDHFAPAFAVHACRHWVHLHVDLALLPE